MVPDKFEDFHQKKNREDLEQQYIINCKDGTHEHKLAVTGAKGISHFHCHIDEKIYTFNLQTQMIIGDGKVSVLPKP